MRFRFLNEFWAYLRGYSWTPCPKCGRMFGGHEVGNSWFKNRWTHYGMPTCSDPECVADVEAHNARVLLHAD